MPRRSDAAGSYSAGASLYGLLGMAGNVWEWTATPDSGAYVLRGGSWFGVLGDARCAFRGRFGPDLRDYAVGFRCCVSSTSSP